MNKKEISEIKKQFTPERCSITRLCGCYVDAEKNKKAVVRELFLSLAEEESFKYFDIFRKALSGTLGKNLLNLAFRPEQEAAGGTRELLLKLRETGLEDEELVDSFYDRVIGMYESGENYYIILIRAVYDIPGKASDGSELFDGSENVYDHILCCICPVSLSKAGLCYNAESGRIEDAARDWLVDLPEAAFLYPLFNDRSADIHGLLYYSKNANQIHGDFISDCLGCEPPMGAESQKDSFTALIENTLGEDCQFETVVSIHEKVSELIAEQKDEPNPVSLGRPEVRQIFEDCGVAPEKLTNFDEQYEIAAGEEGSSLMAANITNTSRLEVKTEDISIKIAPEKAQLIETRVIDGRTCLIIPLEGEALVNGVHLSGTAQKPETGGGED